MRRVLLLLLLAVVVAVSGVAGWYYWRLSRTLQTLNSLFPMPDSTAQQEAAIAHAAGGITGLQPNLYVRFTSSSLTDAVKGLAPPLTDDQRSLDLRIDEVSLGEQIVTVRMHFHATVPNTAISLTGNAPITTAVSVEADRVLFYPIAASISVEKADGLPSPISDATKKLVTDVGQHILSEARRFVSRIVVPVPTGLQQSIDLSALLKKDAGDFLCTTDVSQSTIDLRVFLDKASLLVTPDRLEVLAGVQTMSTAAFEATVVDLRNAPAAAPAVAPCRECSQPMMGAGIGGVLDFPSRMSEYLSCTVESALCRQRSPVLAGASFDPSKLTGRQRFVLRQLARSPQVSDRELYAKFSKWVPLEPKIELPPPGVERKSNPSVVKAAFDKYQQAFTAQAGFDDFQTWIAQRSGLAIKRELLADTINEYLSPVVVHGQCTMGDRTEPIKTTVRTDPAPNLNCGNMRGCNSDFSYPPYNPRGCRSDCAWYDVGCHAEKASCEIAKQGEKTAYESAKAVAQADFAAKKLDCERLKVMERAGCEINQQWLKSTAEMELADINGSATIRGGRGEAQLSQLGAEPVLNNISVQSGASLAGDVSGQFEFIPKNAGHIVCVASWSGRLSARVNVSFGPSKVTLGLNTTETERQNAIVFDVPEQELTLKVSPPPGIALLAQNPQFVLACPVPAALFAGLSGIAPPVGQIVQIKLVLTDEFKVKTKAAQVKLAAFDTTWVAGPRKFKPAIRAGQATFMLAIEPQ